MVFRIDPDQMNDNSHFRMYEYINGWIWNARVIQWGRREEKNEQKFAPFILFRPYIHIWVAHNRHEIM